MPNMVADLQKAAKKINATHFKKAAAHHAGLADAHEKCSMAHKAHAEARETALDEEGSNKKVLKASISFHKSKAAHHEKCSGMYKKYSEHLGKMAATYEEDDTKKAVEILGIDPEEIMTKTDETTKTPETPAVPPPAVPVPAPAADLTKSLTEALSKTMDEKLTAFKADLEKTIDEKVKAAVENLEKAKPADTTIKSFPVPRTGTESIDIENVDPMFAELCKIEG